MGDAAREPVDGFHFGRLSEFLLASLERITRALVLRELTSHCAGSAVP